VYIPGGVDYSHSPPDKNTLWMYDPATDRMIRKADMPRRTSRGVSGVIGGKLYVLMGACADCPTNDWRRLDRYDPVTNTWATLPAAPHPHMGGFAGVINGKFYVAGGSESAHVDVFDPATKRWTTVAPMPFSSAQGGTNTSAVLNGRLYVVGMNDPDRRTYAYNPATNTWNAKARHPTSGAAAAVPVRLNGAPHMLTIGSGGDTRVASYIYTP
jgi:N-acetylneuraminic acid mutarotase